MINYSRERFRETKNPFSAIFLDSCHSCVMAFYNNMEAMIIERTITDSDSSSMKLFRACMIAHGFLIILFLMFYITIILDIIVGNDILLSWTHSIRDPRHDFDVDTNPDPDLNIDRPRPRIVRMEASMDSPITHSRHFFTADSQETIQ